MKRTNRERVKAGPKSVKRAVGRRKAKPLWAEPTNKARAMGFFVCLCSKLAAGPAKAKPLWAEPTAKASVRLVKFG